MAEEEVGWTLHGKPFHREIFIQSEQQQRLFSAIGKLFMEQRLMRHRHEQQWNNHSGSCMGDDDDDDDDDYRGIGSEKIGSDTNESLLIIGLRHFEGSPCQYYI